VADLTPVFQGEVQFRRWSDSSTQGVQVTFALPDSEALEPLKHKAGKRFMAVLVEIGDDEQPVQQPPKKRGPLCIEATDLCKLPDFQQWATLETGNEPSASDAAEHQRFICTVESRKEFDTDADAGERFIRLVRIPFMKWQRAQRSSRSEPERRAA
jgi:hypothetical protein